jgi:hypothetical protein
MVSLIITVCGKLAVASWDKNDLHQIQVWELDEILTFTIFLSVDLCQMTTGTAIALE